MVDFLSNETVLKGILLSCNSVSGPQDAMDTIDYIKSKIEEHLKYKADEKKILDGEPITQEEDYNIFKSLISMMVSDAYDEDISQEDTRRSLEIITWRINEYLEDHEDD